MIKFQNKILCKNLIYIFLISIALSPAFVSASVMSSENYQMGTNAIGSGVSGALQTQSSANYTIEYPWQDTTTSTPSSSENTSSTETTTGGGGIIGGVTKGLPSHINAFNVPLIVTEKQSGTLTYNFPGDKSIIVDTPKGIVSKEITIVINTERLSEANGYLVPQKSDLIGKIFWNIMAIDSDGNVIRQFDKYITITLQIPDLLIGAKKLGVYFLDENESKWILVPGAIFTETTAVFRVNHLTKFAILDIGGKKEVSDNANISIIQDAPQETPNIIKISLPAKGIEIREVDLIKPKGSEKIEQLFENNIEADDAQVADTKKESLSSSWKSWTFFLVLIIIVWYLVRSRKRKFQCKLFI